MKYLLNSTIHLNSSSKLSIHKELYFQSPRKGGCSNIQMCSLGATMHLNSNFRHSVHLFLRPRNLMYLANPLMFMSEDTIQLNNSSRDLIHKGLYFQSPRRVGCHRHRPMKYSSNSIVHQNSSFRRSPH